MLHLDSVVSIKKFFNLVAVNNVGKLSGSDLTMTEAFSRNIGKVSKRKYVSENSIFRLSGSVTMLQCGWRFAHISISSVKRVECGM